jgi:hypothetical protein
MFVDDILLLSKADLAEWHVILDILQHFCFVSGLSINPAKSTVHFWGLSETKLTCLKFSIPYTFFDLNLGFRYLGYQLKLGASSSCDWSWLVAIFERRIGFWCNKWLSLGGRLILVKSVLESLVVYLMTLERIPKKIISQLRRLSFKFLWNDLAGKRRFQLCSWQTLSRPKRSGGWGLKNLAIFNTTLLANSFWRAVTLDSIWHRVIMDKYIGAQPLHLWLRKTQLLQKRASPFWRGLVSSSPVILHWLRWWPGLGSEIKLGRDKLLGLDDRSILSLPLRSHLGSLNFFSLAQMKVETRVSPLLDRWLHSRDFPLIGSMAREWDSFLAALKQAGISLTEARDALIWARGDATGRVTVKNIYVALLPTQDVAALPPWLFQMWKWPIPLKLILFIWLCANEKALTWEVLRKKGWHGPGLCYLCRRATEEIHHLLIHCTFTTEVWNRVLHHFSLTFT